MTIVGKRVRWTEDYFDRSSGTPVEAKRSFEGIIVAVGVDSGWRMLVLLDDGTLRGAHAHGATVISTEGMPYR